MVSLLEFRGLDQDEQAELTWHGRCLANRVEGGLAVMLFRVGEFYAEVFYD